MPPEISRLIGSPFSLPANSRKGKMAWKMSRVEAAGESALILMVRSLSAEGARRGRKSSVWLPTARPLVSALVARAR